MFPVLAFGLASPGDTIALAVAIIPLLFWVSQVIDVVKRQFPSPYLKAVWVLIVVVFNIFGAVVYYGAGRAQGTLPQQTKAA